MQTESERLEILKRAAAVSDFGYGVWAYETWEEFNVKYFDGKLVVGGIFWGLTPHGHNLSFYLSWRNSITLHTSLVNPVGDAWGIPNLLGEKFAADVLLHEMIHQYIHQFGDKDRPEESHNSEAWSTQVNRLIPLLNIETSLKAAPIKQKRVDKKVAWYVPPGCMTRRQLAGFPHTLREETFYEKPAKDLGEKIGLFIDV